MPELEAGCFLFLFLIKKGIAFRSSELFYTSMAGRNFDAVHDLVGNRYSSHKNAIRSLGKNKTKRKKKRRIVNNNKDLPILSQYSNFCKKVRKYDSSPRQEKRLEAFILEESKSRQRRVRGT